jgi:hypothetical protein
MWLSVVVGVAALLLAALTDHPTGVVRIIPHWLHLWVDRAVGVVFVIAPFAFKFVGLDAWYYWVLAAGVLLTTSVFNAPEEPVATRSRPFEVLASQAHSISRANTRISFSSSFGILSFHTGSAISGLTHRCKQYQSGVWGNARYMVLIGAARDHERRGSRVPAS